MFLKIRVFYSKDLPENHFFFSQESNIDWLCQSLIEIEHIDFELDNTDNKQWLFFSSANGVKSFIAQANKDLENYRIACVGKSTAHALPKNIRAEFIGEGNIEEVGNTFQTVLASDHCIFVASKEGMNNIQKRLPSGQVSSVVAYQTLLKPTPIPPMDCYFFTSPSNVRAFAKSNSLNHLNKVIAMGRSTQNELSDLGIPSTLSQSFEHSDQFQTILAQTHSL